MPSLASAMAPARIADGAGKNSKAIAPKRTDASHAARIIANTMSPGQFMRGRIRRLSMADRFVQVVAVGEELRQLPGQHLVAWPGDIDGDDVPNPAGTAVQNR